MPVPGVREQELGARARAYGTGHRAEGYVLGASARARTMAED